MKKEDNKDIQMRHLQMENVRLSNENARLKAHVSFPAEENIAIDRMSRHIAIGRRNRLHTGSHFATENIAFMYSLLESYKLNSLNFGEYIEDILTRLMKGEKADASFLPNNYVPRLKKESNEAA